MQANIETNFLSQILWICVHIFPKEFACTTIIETFCFVSLMTISP